MNSPYSYLGTMSTDRHSEDDVRQFLKDITNDNVANEVRFRKVKQLFLLVLNRITEETQVLFTNTFSKLSYAQSLFNLTYKETYLLHSFRKIDERAVLNLEGKIELGVLCIQILLSKWLDNSMPHIQEVDRLYRSLSQGKRQEIASFQKEILVEIHHIDIEGGLLSAQLYNEPYTIIQVDFSISDRNEDFRPILKTLDELGILPIQANLIDVEIYGNGKYAPSSLVLEPNLLYPVTSIADCFGAFSSHEVGFLMKKFTSMPSSRALIIGNLVNYFLDQLVYNPQLQFKDLLPRLFQQDPLGIAKLKNSEVREMIEILQDQFSNISDVVQNQLGKIGVVDDTSLVEPTFYSAKYGIQGRLDLFAEREDAYTIIELKSGTPFRANTYGLSNTHYHQTLLYDMLIESVYGSKSKRSNFILYSKETKKPLRFAPALKVQQRETIKARNRLYLHDRTLQKSENIIQTIKSYTDQHVGNIKGFLKQDLSNFFNAFENLDALESRYAHSLIQFVINEWLISKVGHNYREGKHGLSGIWTNSLEDKKDQFNILNQLTLSNNRSDADDPILIFKCSYKTAEISNFRVGDLGVLYPHSDAIDSILHHQIFKVTVLHIAKDLVKVRLRSRQDNPLLFKRHTYWNIEHDHLDNGYTNLTRSIYEWAQADQNFRSLIMAREMPRVFDTVRLECSHHLSEEQSELFAEVVHAKDYYLLWGPPGTGKTSVMLREIVSHYLNHRKERILILAYTNRAVDEICQSLLTIDPQPDFIRIGSKYSTGEEYESYLLQNKIEGLSSRKALKGLLQEQQMYVGTIASVLGKRDLFDLVSFDLAIVDEASQILEHALLGLLSRVKKFVLIGDHQQLPAVVQQHELQSKVEDEELQELGILDFRNSLFERLYNQARAFGWEHAYGKLTYQGRMHQELMDFPSRYFYQNELKVLPSLGKLTQKITSVSHPNKEVQYVLENRKLYIPTPSDSQNENIKVNQYEADICVEILAVLIAHYTEDHKEIRPDQIGIITPYRAQIALIKKKLEEKKIIDHQHITIDTVERYQGGARDIIIMSTCMNYSFQMRSLVSLSNTGVDRKLNVALTRARHQFILIGNPNILFQNEMYELWIKEAKEIKWQLQ